MGMKRMNLANTERRDLSRSLVMGALLLLAALPSLAQEEMEATLWLAEASGTFEMRRGDHTVRTELPDHGDPRALAVDWNRGVLWTVAGGALRARWLEGDEFLAAPVEVGILGDLDQRIFLQVDELGGTAWVASGNRLQGRSPLGETIYQQTFEGPVRDLELSPEGGPLWLAHREGALALDPLSGREMARLDLPEIRSLVPRGLTGELWVTTGDRLLRFDAGGGELLSVPADNLRELVSDGEKGVWAIRGREILRLSQEGEELLAVAAFPEPLFPKTPAPVLLQRDTATGSLWAASSHRLVRLTRAGWVQEALDLGAQADLRDFSPGLGLGADEVGPELVIRAPARGSTEVEMRPVVAVEWSDEGSGVDPESLILEVNGRTLAAQCSPSPRGASCQLGEDFAEGSVHLLAGVKDFRGNRAAPAESHFTVRVERTEEEEEPPTNADDPGPPLPDSTPSYYTFTPPDRGQTVNKVYLTEADIESISTSSGNITLSVPLGQTYSVGPVISYQLRVTHNSNVWQEVSIPCDVSAEHRPSNCDGNEDSKFLVSVPNANANAGLGWEFHFGKLFSPTPPSELDVLNRQRYPTPQWDGPDGASASWLYVAPDGASHRFHNLPDRDGGHFTTDGSFLRLSASETEAHVQHPNGMVSIFERSDAFEGTQFCGGTVTGCWRMKKVIDPYSNEVSVSYLPVQGSQEIWEIKDSTGRLHQAVFDLGFLETGGGNGPSGYSLPNPKTGRNDEWGDLRRILSEVKVAAFGGVTQTYEMSYQPVQSVQRGRLPPNTSGNATPKHLTTRILDAIEATGFGENKIRYDFITHTSGTDLTGKIKEWTLPTHGRIQYDYGNWYFPTTCRFKSPRYNPNSESPPLWTQRFGIREKRRMLESGGEVATWTYRNGLWPLEDDVDDGFPWIDDGITCTRPDYMRTVVDGPDRLFNSASGSKLTRQVFYSSTTEGIRLPSDDEPLEEWQTTDNGLPFTKETYDGSSFNPYIGEKLFLSQETLDCPDSVRGDDPTSEDTTMGGICQRDRSIYVRYASEFNPHCYTVIGNAPGCWQHNAVKVYERTVFEDDLQQGEPRYRDQIFEQFNGLGAFRKVTTRASHNWDETEYVETTTYDSGHQVGLAIDGESGYFNVETPAAYYPAGNEPWLLQEYSQKTVRDATSSFTTAFRFDGKGSLICQRRFDNGSTLGQNDLLTVIELGAEVGRDAGLPVKEITAGGSREALDTTGDLCSIHDAQREDGTLYEVEHKYAFLQRASSRVTAPPGGAEDHFPTHFEIEVDRNTGLPKAEISPAGERRELSYDTLGRLTRVTPDSALGEATTQLTHSNPPVDGEGASNASVKIEELDGGSVLTRRTITFDDFGRVRQTEVRRPLPGGGKGSSKTEVDYHSSGVKRYETVLHGSNAFPTGDTAPRTLVHRVDPQGKATKVTGPDGAVTESVYFGERRVKTIRQAWLAQGAPTEQNPFGGESTEVETGQFYDALGRLERVEGPEIEDSGSPLWVTTYRRDALGRVTRADRAGQRRTYKYDGKGFLLKACYPEKGHSPSSSNAGCVKYQDYTAFGQPRVKKDGPFEVRYAYDLAGRLVKVSEKFPTGIVRPLKEYFYRAKNRGSGSQRDWSQGKLGRAKRHNYIQLEQFLQAEPSVPVETDFVVTETYRYQGVGGRLSNRRTSVADPQGHLGGAQGFSQSFSYSPIGQLVAEQYPDCTGDACSQVSIPRTLGYGYVENFLTKLSGFGSSPTRLAYHDNGALSRVEHSTGSVDEIGLDPHRMGRPSYLRSLRPNQQEMFSSGTYLYDGSGNIRSIGEDDYVYDAASRLVGAEVGFEGSTTLQAFHYDGADNLLRIDTGANQQALFPDPMTSQLAGNTYDTAGNLIQGGSLGSFSYDSLGMVKQATGSANKKHQYVLTPEEERLLV
ncbi:MAG: hypothetical protein K0U98_24770, partial [Deltaproteobacteria bacterium]|nr:hypothetical protein [Deltaproteobacteria bacterium]